MSLFQPCDNTSRSLAFAAASRSALTWGSLKIVPSFVNSTSNCGIAIAVLPLSHRLNGPHEVHQPAPLEVALAPERRGAFHEDALHLLRPADEFLPDGKE